MPYASEAQRRKFHAMEARGEIDPATVKEFDQASKGKKLPDRKTPQKRVKKLGLLKRKRTKAKKKPMVLDE